MAEILGVGVTHSPSLITPDEDRNFSLTRTLRNNDRIPPEMKDPRSWPEQMRLEWGEDAGYTSALRHRERLVSAFRKVRVEIDAFKPDLIVVWGDDQYENFKEDIIPAFCVLAYDRFECRPFTNKDGGARRNVWGEPADKVFSYRGHPASRFLAGALLEQGFDVAYAYRPLHEPGLGHAFLNTLLYLDYDRTGFDYPILPFQVNCYGSRVIRNRGGSREYHREPDPPGPTPGRCMALGAATARALRQSPWRVALIASSSWSHAFLTEKHHWLWPDVQSDRQRYEELRAGDYAAWRSLTTAQMEDAGQQEMLNWICLAGAMEELGHRPDIVDYIETYIFNSSKCMALMKP